MDLIEIMSLKHKGIANLDNVIFICGYSEEDSKKLMKYLIERYDQNINFLDVKKLLDGVRDQEDTSYETLAVKYILTMQNLYDTVMHSNELFIVSDIDYFYNNQTVEVLGKSNSQFMLWYISYQLQFNAIMQLYKNKKAKHFSIFNIENYSDIIDAFNKGLEEINKALNSKMLDLSPERIL